MWRCPRCETINRNENENCVVCRGEKVISRSPHEAEYRSEERSQPFGETNQPDKRESWGSGTRTEAREVRPESTWKKRLALFALVAGVFALGFSIAFFLSRGDEPAPNHQETSEAVDVPEAEPDLVPEPEPEVEELLTAEEIWAKAMEAEDYIESYSRADVSIEEWTWSFEGESTTTLAETWLEGEVIVNDQNRLFHASMIRTIDGEESVTEQFLKREDGVAYIWTNYNRTGWTKSIQQESGFEYFDATSSVVLLGEETIEGALTYKLEVGLSRDFIDAINQGEAENSYSVWSFLEYGSKAIVYVDQSTFHWIRFEVDSTDAMERHFLNHYELDQGWTFSAVQDQYIINRSNFNEIRPFEISEAALRVGVNPFNLDVWGRENVIQIEEGDMTLLVPIPEGAVNISERSFEMVVNLESTRSAVDDLIQVFLDEWDVESSITFHIDETSQWENTIEFEYRIHELGEVTLLVIQRTWELIGGREQEETRFHLYQEYEGYTLFTVLVFTRGNLVPELFEVYGYNAFFEAGILTWDDLE